MSSPFPAPDPEAGRLDSWKQIAAYLDKSERTVRRWQETEELPVHKHLHRARGSVWAYRHEIDEWLAARRVSPRPLTEEPAAPARRRAPAAIAIGIAAAMAAAIGAWIYSRGAPPPAPALVPAPFTALPGGEFGPAFSPDGRQVAFFWGPPHYERIGIYVKSRDSEQPAPLDTGNGFAYSPAWSPDGKTVAFLRRTADAGETWLCLVGARGGPARNLAKLAARPAFFASSRHVSWSPDGRWLAAPMQKADGEQGIYAIPVDGGSEGGARRLTESRPAHSPMIGPDGESVAYVRDGGSPHGAYEIVLQALTPRGERAGAARILYRGHGMPAGLDWTPGGKELVLCLPAIDPAHGAGNRLYRLAPEAGAQPAPLGVPGQCTTVAVSGGGGRSTLLFGAAREARGTLWQAARDRLDQPAEFAPSSRIDEYPSFSPDGKTVAFVSSRGGQRDVWVAAAGDGAARRITEGAFVESRPDWSPDGSRLLFGSSASQTKGLMTAPVAGGSAQPVALGGQVAESPVWSRDGRSIYYSSGSGLWRCRADGAERTKLRGDGWQMPVGESPDGRYLYVVRLAKQPELMEMPTGGGTARVVVALSERLVDRDVAMTPRGLYFTGLDGSLYRMPFGGKPTPIRKGFQGVKPFAVLRGLAVSPDDKRVVWGLAGKPEVDLEQIVDFR